MMARKEYLTPEQLHEILSYDVGTGELTWKVREAHWFKDGYRTAQGETNNWNKRYAGKRAGAVFKVGYRYIRLPSCGSATPEHRVIWAMTNGVWPDVIDHINGDKLDNRFINLRNVTQKTNMSNAAMWSHNTSGQTGVMFDKRARKWKSYIKVASKMINLGHFTDFEHAVASRLAAEKQHGFTARHGV